MMDGVSTMARERAGCAFRDFKAAAACGLGNLLLHRELTILTVRLEYHAIPSQPPSARLFRIPLHHVRRPSPIRQRAPEPFSNNHPGHRAFTNSQCRNTSERYTSHSRRSTKSKEQGTEKTSRQTLPTRAHGTSLMSVPTLVPLVASLRKSPLPLWASTSLSGTLRPTAETMLLLLVCTTCTPPERNATRRSTTATPLVPVA